MRILHVLDHSLPLQSGYTFRTISILEQQRAFGWETFHITGPRQGESAGGLDTVDGWDFYRTTPPAAFATTPVLREIAEMRAAARRIDEVVREIRPDIIHAYSPVLNAIPALRVGRRHNIPVVYEVRALWEDAATSHGTCKEGDWRYLSSRWLETFALKRADAVVTICEGLRSEIVSRGIAPSDVTVVPNAVNLAEFSVATGRDAALERELRLDGKTVLGFIGSFYAYEGLSVLLDAMPAILAGDPDVRLLLVGGGPEDKNLRAQAERLGLGGAVTFTGRVHHSEVQRYYSLVDALVFPRLKMRLTDLVTPLKPLEAMAQEKLVIASDVGGHHEMIRDNDTGVMFAAGDAAALAERVTGILARRAEWPAFHANGRRYVEAERAWPIAASNYRKVYGKLMPGREFPETAQSVPGSSRPS